MPQSSKSWLSGSNLLGSFHDSPFIFNLWNLYWPKPRLDFEAVGPECFDRLSDVFIREYVIFSFILAAMLATWILSRRGPLGTYEFAKRIRGNVMTFLIFMYVPSTFLSVGITYCIESNTKDKRDILVHASFRYFIALVRIDTSSAFCLSDGNFPLRWAGKIQISSVVVKFTVQRWP